MQGCRTEFDVAVIGGGPAGTSAAITAARFGARVGLFEAGEFPRHKVCGEFVSEESVDILRDLAACSQLRGRGSPENCSGDRANPVVPGRRVLHCEGNATGPQHSALRAGLSVVAGGTTGWRGGAVRAARSVPIEGDGPFRVADAYR